MVKLNKSFFVFLSGLGMLFFLGFVPPAIADTLYLKNKQSVEGFIKSENERYVEFLLRIGIIKFERDEIKRIYRSTALESEAIRSKWAEEQLESERLMLIEERRKQEEPPKIEFVIGQDGIIVDAVINEKFPAKLIFDTGASLVVLTNGFAKKAGINIEKSNKRIKLVVADGKQIEARYVILENIKVQDVELHDVEAAIILDNSLDSKFAKDGMLGMSFLKRFNFKMDNKNNRLILEKIKY
jgi:clan AA aspartic protease (TIGR02281 family)